MNLNSKLFLIILSYQCLTIYCNNNDNHTTLNEHNIEKKINITEVAGMIIYRRSNHDVQYLLLKPSYADYFFTPPKGDINKNEDSMETALRITEEETGIKKKDLEIDDTFKKSIRCTQNSTRDEEVTYWLARLIKENQPIKLNREYDEYAWCVLDTAVIRVEFHELLQLLLEIEEYLKPKKSKL